MGRERTNVDRPKGRSTVPDSVDYNPTMDQQEKSALFHRLSEQASAMRLELETLTDTLELACDEWALKRVVCDLIWAAENLSVLRDHALGKRLDDDMGYWLPAERDGISGPRALHTDSSIRKLHEKQIADAIRQRLGESNA